MSFHDDTANSLTERWESNLLAARRANATGRPGQGCFSIQRHCQRSGRLAGGAAAGWPLVLERTGQRSDPRRGPLLRRAAAWETSCWPPSGTSAKAASSSGRRHLPEQRRHSLLLYLLGPLLASLADKAADAAGLVAAVIAFAAAAAAVVLLFRRFDPLPLAAAAVVLAMAVIACDRLNDSRLNCCPRRPSRAAADDLH